MSVVFTVKVEGLIRPPLAQMASTKACYKLGLSGTFAEFFRIFVPCYGVIFLAPCPERTNIPFLGLALPPCQNFAHGSPFFLFSAIVVFTLFS